MPTYFVSPSPIVEFPAAASCGDWPTTNSTTFERIDSEHTICPSPLDSSQTFTAPTREPWYCSDPRCCFPEGIESEPLAHPMLDTQWAQARAKTQAPRVTALLSQVSISDLQDSVPLIRWDGDYDMSQIPFNQSAEIPTFPGMSFPVIEAQPAFIKSNKAQKASRRERQSSTVNKSTNKRANFCSNSSPTSPSSGRSGVQLRRVKTGHRSILAGREVDTGGSKVSHNMVERKYRNRINDQFEQLLKVLPAEAVAYAEGTTMRGQHPQTVSKSDTLALAREYICAFEERILRLQESHEEYRVRSEMFEAESVKRG